MAKKRRLRQERPHKFSEAEYRPYALTIGRFCLVWNDLHECLGELFILLWEDEMLSRPAAIWHSPSFDRAKREMLKTLLGTVPVQRELRNPKIFWFADEVKWLLTEIDKLEEVRNNVIHAPLFMGPPYEDNKFQTTVIPYLFLGNRRAEKLDQRIKNRALIDEIKWGYQTTLTLRDYAIWLVHALFSRRKPASPKRPALPNRGQTNARKPPLPAPQAKRPPPLRSSRG